MATNLTDPKRTRPFKVSAVIHHRSAKQAGKRAEEALQEIGERFRLAFENANIGMCLVDLQGRLTKVNHQMCEIFGYSQEELERMTVLAPGVAFLQKPFSPAALAQKVREVLDREVK